MSASLPSSIKGTREVKIGVIPTLLIKDEIITHEQLAYAARVNSKLTTPQTMLDTLLELGLIDFSRTAADHPA